MDNSSWTVILLCAVGTYVMRALPLIWTQKHLAKHTEEGSKQLPTWLSLLGPLMIAAMLGVSLIPARQDWIGAASTIVGCAITLGFWYRSRSLGKPVFAGVVAFGLVTFALSQM